MRPVLLVLTILLTLVGLRSTEPNLYGDPPIGATGKFMQQLTVGGAVAVEDKGDVFELTIWEDKHKPLGYVVAEVDADFVRVRDAVGISDRLIPWWSIKSVTLIRTR